MKLEPLVILNPKPETLNSYPKISNYEPLTLKP
jgi:hypothetical protein